MEHKFWFFMIGYAIPIAYILLVLSVGCIFELVRFITHNEVNLAEKYANLSDNFVLSMAIAFVFMLMHFFPILIDMAISAMMGEDSTHLVIAFWIQIVSIILAGWVLFLRKIYPSLKK